MLLRNESRIRSSIDIKLVFDDNRVRKLTINECDYVQVSYRKNGCIKCGVGVIKEIRPYAYAKGHTNCCKRNSAIIVLDMSEDLVSCVDKIDLYDIIDIRKLKVECPNKPIDPDFDIKRSVCSVGCPITNKGVVTGD